MSLKFEVTEVPAGLESYYTPTESGSFRLNVEGVAPASEVEELKTKLKGFRDTNTNLLKTNQALSSFEQLFGGVQNVSPETLQAKLDELGSKRAEEMVAQMRQKYEEENKALKDGHSKATSQLSELMLGDAVQKAGVQHGVLGTAYDDVVMRARQAFDVKDGVVTFKGQSLDSEGKPYTVATWMAELATKAPHLFAPSQGTGASRNAKGGATPQSGPRTSHDLISSGLNKLTKSGAKRLT